MVEAKLRVEVTRFSNVENPIYGNTIVKNVYEETHIRDFDKRGTKVAPFCSVAPYGVAATFSIDRSYEDAEGKKIDAKEIFDIKIGKYYLTDEDNGAYSALFQHDNKMYELFVHFSGKHITFISLSEWLDKGDFEDGEEADNEYDECVTCDIVEC